MNYKLTLPPEAVQACERRGYKVLNKIGSGGYASIYKVHSAKYNQFFAVKVLPLLSTSVEIDSFKAEVGSIRKLLHSNIIFFYDEFCESNYAFIVMEYCEHGSLLDYQKKHKELPAQYLDVWTSQLISAVVFLHHQGIAHADLKPANILIDSNMRIKLADFGISKFYNSGECSRSGRGSLAYMPPEKFSGAPYDPFKADLWSLGITIAHMYLGHIPWQGRDKSSIINEIKAGIINLKSVDSRVSKIISQLTVHDPIGRTIPPSTILNGYKEKNHKNTLIKNSLFYGKNSVLVRSHGPHTSFPFVSSIPYAEKATRSILF